MDKNTTFCRAYFHRPDLVTIQSQMKEYVSCSSNNLDSQKLADFWTIVNYWKHYYPFLPRPSDFTIQNVRDFKINIGEGNETSPILKDLIIPIFNGACKNAQIIATEEMLEETHFNGIINKLQPVELSKCLISL